MGREARAGGAAGQGTCGLMGVELNPRGKVPLSERSESDDKSCGLSASHSLSLDTVNSLSKRASLIHHN